MVLTVVLDRQTDTECLQFKFICWCHPAVNHPSLPASRLQPHQVILNTAASSSSGEWRHSGPDNMQDTSGGGWFSSTLRLFRETLVYLIRFIPIFTCYCSVYSVILMVCCVLRGFLLQLRMSSSVHIVKSIWFVMLLHINKLDLWQQTTEE